MNNNVEIKGEVQAYISDFNQPFTRYLVELGLPVEGILAPIGEREIVINTIEKEINKISPENRDCCIFDAIYCLCCSGSF